MEKGDWPSAIKISRMDSLGVDLEYGRIRLGKSSCLKEQALIIDKDGSLKATDDFEHIPPDRNSLKVGKTPYFLKISEIRGIIYISEGLRT